MVRGSCLLGSRSSAQGQLLHEVGDLVCVLLLVRVVGARHGRLDDLIVVKAWSSVAVDTPLIEGSTQPSDVEMATLYLYIISDTVIQVTKLVKVAVSKIRDWENHTSCCTSNFSHRRYRNT